MKIFAIELSSSKGSVALIEDGVTLAQKQWVESFKNRQQLFDAMVELNVDWDHVDFFVVGRGPGAFSGMRISFSVASALAAPRKTPVFSFNSGSIIAASVVDADCVTVVGDARRKKVWAGVFRKKELEGEFQLMPTEDFLKFVPEDAVVVSPDYDRLKELLKDCNTLGISESIYPSPETLGKVAFKHIKDGVESEPFEPLYMHPPVFVEPRFPA